MQRTEKVIVLRYLPEAEDTDGPERESFLIEIAGNNDAGD
jgi:hypothetical protein